MEKTSIKELSKDVNYRSLLSWICDIFCEENYVFRKIINDFYYSKNDDLLINNFNRLEEFIDFNFIGFYTNFDLEDCDGQRFSVELNRGRKKDIKDFYISINFNDNNIELVDFIVLNKDVLSKIGDKNTTNEERDKLIKENTKYNKYEFNKENFVKLINKKLLQNKNE